MLRPILYLWLLMFITIWKIIGIQNNDKNTLIILHAIDSMRTEFTITAEPIDSIKQIKPDSIFIDCYQDIDTVDHYYEEGL